MEEENRRLRQEIAELTARLELQQSKNEIRSIGTYPARTGTSKMKLFLLNFSFYFIYYFLQLK
jgi:hypothetical protein